MTATGVEGAEGSAIETRGLGRRFGGVAAVDNLSVSLPVQAVVGVIGPNGAGKTTLLNLIAGQLAPSDGQILIHGQDVTGWPSHAIARLGVARTFQGARLVGDLSVRNNVALGQCQQTDYGLRSGLWMFTRSRRATRSRLAAVVDETLRDLGLTAVADQPAGDLSYGTKRRVELARVIVGKAKLVLLDEPAAGLNGGEREQLAEDINRLRAGGATVVLVEHDVGLMMQLADSILVLDHGQLLVMGSPEEVQQNPAFIESYIGIVGGSKHA